MATPNASSAFEGRSGARDGMADIKIERINPNAPPAGLWELLALSVGCATVEKLERIRASYTEADRGLTAAFANGHLAGVIGYRRRETELEITHIVVREGFRRQGVARVMISAALAQHVGLDAVAETDDEAVGFYRAIGFRTEALPCGDNRTQRWRCRFPDAPEMTREQI